MCHLQCAPANTHADGGRRVHTTDDTQSKKAAATAKQCDFATRRGRALTAHVVISARRQLGLKQTLPSLHCRKRVT